ncbi:hypothetical protein T10_7534 [Trichinella papuae]|uniref:PiggyBac transposable element-derived protein domain-containing protein n=1 Tax=Trichinella papuae TaxID=268474 RepID=A0A0V1MEY4_9BILA|nr:hypothetical protein T10_7534 [Trichinella papuae]
MDNFFTSIPLAEDLLGKKTTIVGTLLKNKKEVPAELTEARGREVDSSLFCFDQQLTLVSYIPKRKNCVLLLPTMHYDDAVREDQEESRILCYLIMERSPRHVRVHTCKRRIQRLRGYCGICYKSYGTCKNEYWNARKSHRRRLFLMECGRNLVDIILQKRAASPPQSLPYTVRKTIESMGGETLAKQSAARKDEKVSLKRCVFCRRKGDREKTTDLFDSAAERSFIRQDVADELHLQGEPFPVAVNGIGCSNCEPQESRLGRFWLSPLSGELKYPLQALTMPMLCNDIVKMKVSKQAWPHLRVTELPEEDDDEVVQEKKPNDSGDTSGLDNLWTTASFITATFGFGGVHIHASGDLPDSAKGLGTGIVSNTPRPRGGLVRQDEKGIRTNPLIRWANRLRSVKLKLRRDQERRTGYAAGLLDEHGVPASPCGVSASRAPLTSPSKRSVYMQSDTNQSPIVHVVRIGDGHSSLLLLGRQQDCVALDEERCTTVEAVRANRVKEIQHLSSPDCWRHCPTKNSPADLVSRGCLLPHFLRMTCGGQHPGGCVKKIEPSWISKAVWAKQRVKETSSIQHGTADLRNCCVSPLLLRENQTLAATGQRFWITRGRSAVKERITPVVCFVYVGVDFAIPILTTIHGEPHICVKTYICIFTCMVVSAIHLELEPDMTTGNFLNQAETYPVRQHPDLPSRRQVPESTPPHPQLRGGATHLVRRTDRVEIHH